MFKFRGYGVVYNLNLSFHAVVKSYCLRPRFRVKIVEKFKETIELNT
jgi:hypothetical protein